MTIINTDKILENFCNKYNIVPTKEEKYLLKMAILMGAESQSDLDYLDFQRILK